MVHEHERTPLRRGWMAGIVAGVAAIGAMMAGTGFAATGSGDAAAGDASGNASSQAGNINALVPALGFSPGNPNAAADRVGPTGVKVPGRCPPTQAQVNAQVALKNANFPSGTDLESRIQRFEKTLSAIQDLKCPAASTTLLGRLNSLTALRANANRDNILRGLGLNETPADKAAGNAAPQNAPAKQAGRRAAPRTTAT